MDSYLKVGPEEDPYFEEIPDNELHFYQRKGAKRRRKLPDFIPKNDLKVLNSVKRKAYRLDLQLSMCGIRLGWAGIIGLIPWIGDILALVFALQLVKKAQTIDGGLPAHVKSQMMANVMFDFGIGLIPIVGDLINIAYKCNLRNFVLLEQHLVHKYGSDAPVHVVEVARTDKAKKSEYPPDAVQGQELGVYTVHNPVAAETGKNAPSVPPPAVPPR